MYCLTTCVVSVLRNVLLQAALVVQLYTASGSGFGAAVERWAWRKTGVRTAEELKMVATTARRLRTLNRSILRDETPMLFVPLERSGAFIFEDVGWDHCSGNEPGRVGSGSSKADVMLSPVRLKQDGRPAALLGFDLFCDSTKPAPDLEISYLERMYTDKSEVRIFSVLVE